MRTFKKRKFTKDSKGKAIVYILTYRDLDKFHVGLAENIKHILKNDYNLSYLKNYINKTSICRSVLKYGYSAFNFYIVEYYYITFLSFLQSTQ